MKLALAALLGALVATLAACTPDTPETQFAWGVNDHIGRTAPAELPEATARPLLRAAAEAGAPAVDLPALRASLDALAAEVRAAFIRHVGEIKVGEIKG